jgi:hypothetical protein
VNTAAVEHAPIWQAVGAVGAILAGCLLFFAGRRLAWGRDQSLADWPLWIVAALPYIAYFAAIRWAVVGVADFVKRSDFLYVWTVSLGAFVLMRTSSLAWIYEASIYDTTVVGLTRYAIISAVYICFGFLTVIACRLTVAPRRGEHFSLASRMAGLIVAYVLFCAGIFLIAP